MTERASCRFRVKENKGWQPWIMLEPQGVELFKLRRGTLGFHLAEGTSLDEAQQIATYLNEKVQAVTFTA